MDCLVQMEEAGQIQSDVRIKRYTPTDPENKEAITAVYQFFIQHNLNFAARCLRKEVNWEIPEVERNPEYSDLADRILAEPPLPEEEEEEQSEAK
jgi:hypothetical protein